MAPAVEAVALPVAGWGFFDGGNGRNRPIGRGRGKAGDAWTNEPWADSNFFPIAVWLQDPAHAERYRKAGINTYVGLWEGPTGEQLAALKKAGLWAICGQNEAGLRHRADPTIIGWMHNDEPDNAQSRGASLSFGSPIPPEKIVEDYHTYILYRNATTASKQKSFPIL